MYLTIQHILNLSHTPNLNHNVIIPKQHVKGLYRCVIVQFIAHNSMHTTTQYTCILQFNTLNLSHTSNLNHNIIIPKQHVITPHKSYTHHTILIFTWHKTCIQNHLTSQACETFHIHIIGEAYCLPHRLRQFEAVEKAN